MSEVLLKVENLQQYFKSGKYENKAVDNVSFEVYKGEVFGLVGESGCGKTTTGRSIIRLYDITGGSVYYKGERICAGIRSYKDAINQAKKAADLGEISKEELEQIIIENKIEIQENMDTQDKIRMATALLNQEDESVVKVKKMRKDKGLIEKTESSKIILTEDNRELLND